MAHAPESHQAVQEFLRAHHPFDQLSEQILGAIVERLESRSASAGSTILEPGKRNDALWIIRNGAAEVHDAAGSLLARLGEGDSFGTRSLSRDGEVHARVSAIEDSTLLCLPAEDFNRLTGRHAQFRYFFGADSMKRLRGALQIQEQGESAGFSLMTTPVLEMLTGGPITVDASASIHDAARKMTDHRVSSLLVVANDALVGIVTDRDLRSRVIASGIPYDNPVRDVMTDSPHTISPSDYTHDALIEMARNGFHHLPVLDGNRIVGMITSTDILHRRSASPLYVIGEIYRCNDVECLTAATKRLPHLLVGLVDANASAHSIGHIVTSVGEAVTNRLLTLAEKKLGAAPVPFVWMSGGSQARNEQTALSDQDNCLLLSDDYDERKHGEYFEALARFVCDGLNACGYIYCPGEVMAMTTKWRQPLSVWKRYFETWINQPKPEALLNATVFFDLRLIQGDAELFRALQAHFLERAKANRIFQAYLAANALQFQPPLGFFRNFVLVKGGEHDHTLDLKHRGVVPIIDLARVYALATGVADVNTRDRLAKATGEGGLSADGSADLSDALEFISAIRLRHQATQAKAGRKPDNYVPPADLSQFERNHLKDAFTVVRTMQSSLSQRFQTARFA